MSEPLPHDVNIAKKLKMYGIDAPNEPMMHILGGRLVTAEIDAKRTLRMLASLVELAVAEDADLGDLDAADLTEAAEAVAACHRARRDLLRQADQLGLRRASAVG